MNILLLIVLMAPFFGFVASFVGSCYKPAWRVWVYTPCVMMILSCLAYLATWVIYQSGDVWTSNQLEWIDFQEVSVSWGIYYDTLTAVMVAVILSVSLCVHGYSVDYMAHDPNRARFMSFLNLFTFAMLVLVMSPNLIQMFVGWEGVGLSSYLLIGFWHHRPQACLAAQKAFIVNRIADVGLMIGVLATWHVCHGLDWQHIWSTLPKVGQPAVSTGLLVMAIAFTVAAMGKSAQFGLHVWLPDAMEGPTPVSALIHAATMVTAGVFLIVRFSPLYEVVHIVRDALVIIGLVTTFFAGTVALAQRDIKRIIAYSTCSQLGMMMMACGCGAYPVAIFHLVTHAYFKALLFLGAGAVIHALSDEQDIFQMGGLWRYIPFTYVCVWIGSLALVGAPFFAGYYSKEAIMASIFELAWPGLYEITLICVLLTALYAGRLLFVVFHSTCRAHEQVVAHIHEVKGFMRAALLCLSVGAVASGWIGHHLFLEQEFGFGWGESLVYHPVSSSPIWAHYSPTVLALSGVLVAFLIYGRRSLRGQIILSSRAWTESVHRFLLQKWWIDQLYSAICVKPHAWISRLLAAFDRRFDVTAPDGVVYVAYAAGFRLKHLHTSWLYDSVTWMMVAFILMLVWGNMCRP